MNIKPLFVGKLKSLFVSMIWLVGISLLLMSSNPLWAKKPFFRFDQQPLGQGLTNFWVLKVLQGPQGFIWVATQGGLFRFDGYDYKAFRHDPADPSSLSDNYVHNLYFDSSGVLWLSLLRGGLARFDAKTETFTSYRYDLDNSNSLSNDQVMDISEDSAGDLWIATNNGLNRYHRQTDTFTRFHHNPQDPNSLSGNSLYAVLEDSQGILWIATRDDGLNRLDRTTGEFTHYLHQPDNPDSLGFNRVFTLLDEPNGCLWLGLSGGGLDCFDRQSGKFIHYRNDPDDPHSLGSDYVRSILLDKNGTLWVGTRYGGLNRFMRQQQHFERYLNDPQNEDSLADNDVYSVYQDKDGLIWLGTFGMGVSKFDPASEVFGLVQHDANNPNSLNKSDVWAIFKDKDSIVWSGTDQGLNRYNEETDQFSHYRHDPNNLQSLSANDVSALLVDSAGTLWVGTINGVNRLNPSEGGFIRYLHDSDDSQSLSDSLVYSLHQDSRGKLWVGTGNGLNRFNPETNNFERFYHEPSNKNSLGSNDINGLYTSRDGSMWVATSGGLNQFDQHKQAFKRYVHDANNGTSLSSNMIYSVTEDQQGSLWVGTQGGLNQFDRENEIFVHYRKKDGLSSDRVQAVMVDKSGKLWLGEQGISLFDPVSKNIRTHIGRHASCYGATSGSYFQADDGQLLFGGNYGYCAFYPEQVLAQSKAPTIVLTDFRLLNKSVQVSRDGPLTRVINHSDALILSHKDNILSFEFAALHYGDPLYNQYQYRLEGFNANWIETSVTNRRATYTNLAAGDYTFEVKASNHQGLWSKEARSIGLTILSAPWRTWWAYSLYVLLVFSIIGLFVYQRSIRQKAVNQALRALNATLEDKVELRTQALQDSIDQLKATQQQLVETEKMAALGNLVAGVAHEVNTPLGICITMVSMQIEQLKTLNKNMGAGSMTRKSLVEYIENTEQSQTLVDSNLQKAAQLVQSFKKVAVGQTEDNVNEMVFHDYLTDIIRSITPGLKDKSIEINLLTQGDWVISTWPGAWWQLLSSLVENSLLHGFLDKSSGEITVSAELDIENTHLQFIYRDNGHGMTAEQLDKIYDPFYTTARCRGGTGLGMHIVYNLVVQKLGGSIKCQSEPGQGVVFMIDVPIA